MRHYLHAFILIVSLFGGAFVSVKADPITVKFKSMSMALGSGNLSYKSDGKYVPLTLDALLPSTTVYTYSGENPMQLYLPEVVKDKQTMVPVGHVQFPDGKNFLVFVISQGGDAYTGAAVPADGPDSPPNSVRVLNLTPLKIVTVGNNKTFTLSPGQAGVITVGNDQQYGLTFSAMRDGQLEQVNAAGDKIAPGSRQTLFLTLSNTKQVLANPRVRPMVEVNHFDLKIEDANNGSSQRKRKQNAATG